MLRLKRRIAAVLTASILINTIPANTFAETLVVESLLAGQNVSNVQNASQDPTKAPLSSESESVSASVSELTEPSQELETTENSQKTQQDTESSQESDTTAPLQETQQEAESLQESDTSTLPQETQEVTESTQESEQEGTDSSILQEDIKEENIAPLSEGDETAPTSEGITDTFAQNFVEKLKEAGYNNVISQDENGITLTVGQGQGEILALLSDQDQTSESNYQEWNIAFPSNTGTLTLPDTYKGLGDPDFPFKGKFTGQTVTIVSSKTIFKSLHTQADLNNSKIIWTGTATQPILAYTLVVGNEAVSMPSVSACSFSPYIGTLTGASSLVTLSGLDYSQAGQNVTGAYQGDVGLVCGRMDTGTKLNIEELTLPTQGTFTLKSNAYVGGLVGSMKDGAELTISRDLTINATLQGTQNNKAISAGGLVGSMTNASIIVAEGVNVTVSANLTFTKAAGGIVGEATTTTGPLAENAHVTLNSVSANGVENSGVLYGSCTATGILDPLKGVSFVADAEREVSGLGNCGGVFGTLILNENGKCTITNAEISTSLTSATNTTAYGGVAGELTGERANALVVNDCSFISDIEEAYPKYLGGIIARQKATVEMMNSTITVYDPKTATATERGFGGLVAYVDDEELLIADTMKVIVNTKSTDPTECYKNNLGGGGVVGSAHKGSIIYLKQKLDLSECPLSTNATSGQIVGAQDCSLIYAPDVQIQRLNTQRSGSTYKGMEMDDVGNYGELYRLESFLTVGDNYVTNIPKISSNATGGYEISSRTDYACLALAWQARGYFHTVDGINNSNWETLKFSAITLGVSIDMTACGIGGLTRDVNVVEAGQFPDMFEGSFEGNGHTITLDIGTRNVVNDVSRGDGRIYWHTATGLFAVLSSNATVQNLHLAGKVRVSNKKLTTLANPLKAGGLAALLSSGESNGSIQNVSTEVEFDAECNGSYPIYIGGLIGLISNTNSTVPMITLGFDTTLAAVVSVNHSDNGNYNHVGGVIGAVAEDANVNLVCDGATLGGSIEYKNAPNNIYAGGLVGTIFPRSSGDRAITLTSLTINGFSLSGSASERMGGILGGIWADTDVTVNGLNVSNATLKASGEAALGGLVYRASGKWTVSSVDLSGLTISAGDAEALGILVCQGGSYKDMINGSYKDIDGLYLEMEEHWDWNAATRKGYNVPSNITFGTGVFDEFVAYTGYADRSSDTPSYQITANGSGILSLKTANNTVNMGTGEERNTYTNRTGVGESNKTNPYSRYYYNLSTVKVACTGGNIDTPEELLIWSVYRYAASNLQTYFMISGVENMATSQIGSTSAENRASFDMFGLSYYPVNITNESVTVQYADIKFYNDEIEAKEVGNKLTRGIKEDHSQHYTMHCALFLNFNAENITKSETRTMTVNGVTFSGTVGMVNDGSGALICGTVEGESKAGYTSRCTVILADADDATKAVSLGGISVLPNEDYSPVLINKIGSYAGLNANYVITTGAQTMTAGSSLIGDVGGQDATDISIEFAGTIILPDKNDPDTTAVFTKATLLNSLRYENGSATYHFFKEKEYPSPGASYQHNATYGQELSTTVEYANKQGCYNDGYGDGYYIKEGVFNETGFSAYLPYVACSPAISETGYPLSAKWHELAVNVLYYDLTDGCGTYGHPYQIDSENFNLLIDAASYINTGKAANGWKIKISDNGVYHNTDSNAENNDILLTYKAGVWTKSDGTSYEGDVQKYLASAYYQINEDITLTHFSGIGTDGSGSGVPFNGVITGKIKGNNDYPTVTLSGGSSAFIKYSYGSVVRNLNIVLNQSLSLSWVSQQTSSTRVAEQAPKTFFGGVIGCVLGGDNIIDNVKVSGGNSVTVVDMNSKNHLVPMGGYVGVISGGGVIFRGTCNNNAAITGTDNQLYRNPIIGRVLDGYAFYEGDGNAPDNGDKNYKINKITSDATADLSWDESTLTVNNAQGLLILSAIVSSGAGSKSSYAYAKGKARNADYDQIGAGTETADATVAKKDSGDVWKDYQTPYLLSKYAAYTGSAEICSNSTNDIEVKFKNDDNTSFNMSGYGNGYRSLSARYVSNAAFASTSGAGPVDASAVVMRVRSFDGGNVTVQNISMDVKEYDDDDFHAASMGGIFNIVWTKKSSGGKADSVFAKNLTLANCKVSLQYINSNGEAKNQADTTTFTDADGLSCVAVGGLIGSISDVEGSTMTQITSNYLFRDLRIEGTEEKKCVIEGPTSAGGIIGATAMTNSGVTGYPGKLLSNSKSTTMGPNFLNCSYSYIEVSGKLAAGGLVGYVFAGANATVPNFDTLGLGVNDSNLGCYTSCTSTGTTPVGSNSAITAQVRGSVCGGILGASGIRIRINYLDIDKVTGLAVLSEESISSICLNKVTLKASSVDDIIERSSNEKNGLEKGGQSTVGGCVGRIGNVNPACFYDVRLDNCSISTGKVLDNEFAGGIVGLAYNNTSVTIERCQVVNQSRISSRYSGGLVGYGRDSDKFNLNISDCKIDSSFVNGSAYAGGLVGQAKSKCYLYNILLKNTEITKGSVSNGAGRLFGTVSSFTVYAAGISVYSDNANRKIPTADIGNGSYSAGFIAYADYSGEETIVNSQLSPYVTVNPNFSLQSDKTLYGDAVGKIDGDTYNSTAVRIWADKNADTETPANYALYSNINDKSMPTVSTFSTIQGFGPDLPVLVLKGGDDSIIEDYLNIITNGGYDKARKSTEANNKVVLKDVGVYYYDDAESKTFQLADQSELTQKKEPASIYLDSSTGKYCVNNTSYDNTRSRFSLLEAEFSVQVDGKPRIYTVSVPVVVIRKLQYNFMATLNYGKEFYADAFSELKNHVLESTGNPFTAYLTYQYNCIYDQTANKLIDSEYDWQSYMDGGGDMLNVDKKLIFDSTGSCKGLPSGTQLILLDRQNGNKAYQYTIKDADTVSNTSIKLSKFTSVSDGTYFHSSMAEILGVDAVQNDEGNFVKTTVTDNAKTVRLKDDYYRLFNSETDGELPRYTLTVPDPKQQEGPEDTVPEENYYLVIMVPRQMNRDFKINGSLTSSLVWHMPNEGSQTHRYNGSSVGVGDSDESTYLISTGYQQTLETKTDDKRIDLGDAAQKMQLQVKDTITFSNGQAYGNSDQLFLKFTANLQRHTINSENVTDVEEIQFPVGTMGTVHFYIQNTDGVYYVMNNGAWSHTADKTEAASYDWTSQGANLELLLSDGNNALDLSGLRKLIKGSQNTGDSQIIVTAEMDITFGSSEILTAAVPASEKAGTDTWVQLHYVGQISTQEASLDYSAMRTTVTDETKYYRGVQYQAVLSMDAAHIDQLGINPMELVPDYLTTVEGKNASKIDLTAALNLSSLQNIESILQNTESITFTLSLLQRKGNDYVIVENASQYIDFDLSSYNASGWSWTIPRDQYYKDSKIIITDIFDGTQFTMPITAYVFTNQKNYANYKIMLAVEFNNNSSTVAVTDGDAYVVYTFACIKPSFYEPQGEESMR